MTLQLDLPTASIFLLVNSLIGFFIIVFLGWLSDRIGRLRMILAGFLLAATIVMPGMQLLSRAANPDLVAFQGANPIVLRADPATCQFHVLVGPWTKLTACDQVRGLLAVSVSLSSAKTLLREAL